MRLRPLYQVALLSFLLPPIAAPASAGTAVADACSGPYCPLQIETAPLTNAPSSLSLAEPQPECASAPTVAVLGLSIGTTTDFGVRSAGADAIEMAVPHSFTLSCGESETRQFATEFPLSLDLSTPEGQVKAEAVTRYLHTGLDSELDAFLPECSKRCTSKDTEAGMCLAPDSLPPPADDTGECDLCELAEASGETSELAGDSGFEARGEFLSAESSSTSISSELKFDTRALAGLASPIILRPQVYIAANPGVTSCAWGAEVLEQLPTIGSEVTKWETFTDRGGKQRIVAFVVRRTSESTVEVRATQAVLTRWVNGHLADDVVDQLTRQLSTTATRTEYFAPTKAAAARCANPRNLPRLSRGGVTGWIRGVLSLPPSAVFFAAIDISAYIGKEGIPMILGENIMKALQGNGDKLNRMAELAYSEQGRPLLNDTCSACFERNAATFWTTGGPGLWLGAQDQGTRDVLSAYRTRVSNELSACSCKQGGKVARGGQWLKDFVNFREMFKNSIQQGLMPFQPPGFPDNDSYVKLTDICMTTSD